MKRSPHLRLVFDTVASAFVCAEAEGWGVGVAVTYREILLGRRRLLRRSSVQRFRLRDVDAVEIRRGPGVNRLLLSFAGAGPTTVMVLFGPEALADLERLVAVMGILSRRRRRPALQLSRRGTDRIIAMGRAGAAARVESGAASRNRAAKVG